MPKAFDFLNMYKFSIILLSLIEERIYFVRQVTSNVAPLVLRQAQENRTKGKQVDTNCELKINKVVYSHGTLNKPDLV